MKKNYSVDKAIGESAICVKATISIQAAEDKTIATRVYKWNCRVAIFFHSTLLPVVECEGFDSTLNLKYIMWQMKTITSIVTPVAIYLLWLPDQFDWGKNIKMMLLRADSLHLNSVLPVFTFPRLPYHYGHENNKSAPPHYRQLLFSIICLAPPCLSPLP